MEIPRAQRLPPPRSLLVIAAISALVTVACIFTIDQPVARWIGQYEPPAFWERAIDVLEWTLLLPPFRFASAFAVTVGMLATVAVPRWRGHAPTWMWLAAVHLISRLAMIHIKDATGRLRPSEWLAHGGDTFWRADGISFPSGHVVLFASIVIPSAVLWPRTRPLLAVIAFVMLARVAADAHFISDVVGGITLVALVAWATGWVIRPVRR